MKTVRAERAAAAERVTGGDLRKLKGAPAPETPQETQQRILREHARTMQRLRRVNGDRRPS